MKLTQAQLQAVEDDAQKTVRLVKDAVLRSNKLDESKSTTPPDQHRHLCKISLSKLCAKGHPWPTQCHLFRESKRSPFYVRNKHCNLNI